MNFQVFKSDIEMKLIVTDSKNLTWKKICCLGAPTSNEIFALVP